MQNKPIVEKPDAETPKPETHVSVVGASPESANTGFCLEFADGQREIPKWMIEHLGGKDALAKSNDAFKAVTFDEFSESFHRLVSSSELNRLQQQFVAGALARNRRF